MLRKIFGNKKILIVTDDSVTSVPLSISAQLVVIIALFGVISWLSYASGKYFAFQNDIKDKEAEIYQTNLVNLELRSKIDSLQGNLVRLNNYFATVKSFDHNQDAKQKERQKKKYDKTSSLPQLDDKANDIVGRINSNTLERIENLETVIALTGLSPSNVTASSETKLGLFNSYYRPDLSKGGPETHNLDVEQKNSSLELNIEENIGFAGNLAKLFYLESMVNSLPLEIPMSKYYISSLYGEREDPLSGIKAKHYGLDFAGPKNAEIFSTAPGVVKFAGNKGNYGILVVIDHGYNISTRYGHLSKTLVSKGDYIERGQVIGLQGNTGRSTGDHLHYELRYKNNPYDPLKFIKTGKYVL